MAEEAAQLIQVQRRLASARIVVEHRNITVEAFRALADPIRLELVALIAAKGPICVCNLQEAVAHSQPRVSKHLGVLRKAGLVTAERRGSWVYYSLDPDAVAAATDFLGDLDASMHSPHLADSCDEPETA